MRSLPLLLAGCVCAALTAPLTADVIVVSAAGGGAVTAIQPAIDAANDGDTVLVKPGSYFGVCTVDGKALTIVGDAGALPNVSSLWIKNVPLGSTVTLARLKVPGASTTALRVENCQGAVRVVACEASGLGALGSGRHAVELTHSGDVAFARCVFKGGNGFWDSQNCIGQFSFGGTGLLSASSRSAVYDCEIRGGRGGTGAAQSGPGANGVTVIDEDEIGAFLFLAHSLLQGGNAGPTNCLDEDPYGGPGGHGLAMGETLESVDVHLLDDSIFGGLSTAPDWSSPVAPIAGGRPFQYVVSSLELTLPAIAREGEFLTLTFTGDPGDHVYLNDGVETTFDLVPSYRGVVVAPFPTSSAGPVRERRWGVIPASGVLKQIYRAPILPPGVEAQTRFLQAYRVRANGITLGSFAALTVLDSSF